MKLKELYRKVKESFNTTSKPEFSDKDNEAANQFQKEYADKVFQGMNYRQQCKLVK